MPRPPVRRARRGRWLALLATALRSCRPTGTSSSQSWCLPAGNRPASGPDLVHFWDLLAAAGSPATSVGWWPSSPSTSSSASTRTLSSSASTRA
eukprot:3884275-Alexandrium_andersonii.AAC.1